MFRRRNFSYAGGTLALACSIPRIPRYSSAANLPVRKLLVCGCRPPPSPCCTHSCLRWLGRLEKAEGTHSAAFRLALCAHLLLRSSCRRRQAARRSAAARVLASAVAEEPAETAEAPAFRAWTSSFANRHRRTDIKRILILGAGPIVIGQASRCFKLAPTLAAFPPRLLTRSLAPAGVRVRLLGHTSVQGAQARAFRGFAALHPRTRCLFAFISRSRLTLYWLQRGRLLRHPDQLQPGARLSTARALRCAQALTLFRRRRS